MRSWTIHLSLVAAAWLAGCRAAPPPPEPPVDTLISQASALDLAGRHDDAAAIFRDVLRRAPDSYQAHYGLGRALDLAGHYDEAQAHFTRAVELAGSGDRDQATRMLAIAFTFAGDVDKAAATFEQVFTRQNGSGNFAGASDVASEVGRVYLEHGRLDEATRWYRDAHDAAGREADRPAWRVDLADMRWAHAQARIAARGHQRRESEAAVARVAHLLAKGGNDDQQIQYDYLRGYVALCFGEYAAAQQALEHADQKDPFILLLLAQAHAAQGHAEQAAAYYQRVRDSSSHAVSSALAKGATPRSSPSPTAS